MPAMSSFEVENPVGNRKKTESNSGPSFGTLLLSGILLLAVGVLAGFGIAAIASKSPLSFGLNGSADAKPSVTSVTSTTTPTTAPAPEPESLVKECSHAKYDNAKPSNEFNIFVKRGAIYDMITEEEITSITKYMLTTKNDYKLTPYANATISDNYIARITIIAPKKKRCD